MGDMQFSQLPLKIDSEDSISVRISVNLSLSVKENKDDNIHKNKSLKTKDHRTLTHVERQNFGYLYLNLLVY